MGNRVLTREELAIDPVDAAHRLLGCVLECDNGQGAVAVRLVEVEAYRGADDPASHCYRGQTARNKVMFGPAGHLYVYMIYGMHYCANVVSLTDGVPGAVLLRAGEVVSGIDLARSRRRRGTEDAALARGPAHLTTVLGLRAPHNGKDLTTTWASTRILAGDPVPTDQIKAGPRVGVAAAADTPWRFWLDSPAVSRYRPAVKRTTTTRK